MTNRRTVDINGRKIAYSIRFTGKARRLSLRISADAGLVVVAPEQLKQSAIDFERLMRSKSEWILRKLDFVKFHNRVKKHISFVTGSKLDLLGSQITLQVFKSTGKRTRIWLEGDNLIVVSRATDEATIRTVVVAWYKQVAKQAIPERVEYLNRPLRFQYQKIVIRDQKSRWGSCSRRRTLSFNWRMLLIPPSVMDYLLFHELAHLQEMNHSLRFWRLVQEVCPAFRESERWLKKNGRDAFW